ncbi:MAG: hypothetical protein HZB36_04670 [Candidatus Omnitrophica bacterium]|nr:hypothetical protein [Candidatus Omnitrophota bacterium]
MKRNKYGWKPDVPDQRDFLYKAIRPVIRYIEVMLEISIIPCIIASLVIL